MIVGGKITVYAMELTHIFFLLEKKLQKNVALYTLNFKYLKPSLAKIEIVHGNFFYLHYFILFYFYHLKLPL